MAVADVAVLDTNVLLDWLVFDDPRCATWVAALQAGRLQWLATQAMRDELMDVLARGVLQAWQPDVAQITSAWERWACMAQASEPPALAQLRCSDRDDQKFVDAALAGATWLLSRDRAVLKLARRARPWGLRIATPEQWARDGANQCLNASPHGQISFGLR
jgi:predicted nucleic acid-binding protein